MMAGPAHCDKCGTWPAMLMQHGKLCHLCEARDFCEKNPVPLPANLERVRELACLGYKPAIDELASRGAT